MLRYIQNLFFDLAGSTARGPIRKTPARKWFVAQKEALDQLEKHGLRAYHYMPAIGMEDKALAHASRVLGRAGCLVFDAKGRLVGNVYPARPSAEEMVTERRSAFKIVKIEI